MLSQIKQAFKKALARVAQLYAFVELVFKPFSLIIIRPFSKNTAV